jgi:methionine synthase II (cobalamin-independent)
VKALGMLWYSKASNSIIKIMKNIQLEEVEREYKHLLIRECAKSLGIFNLKKSLKPLKDAKVFCKKNYAYDALKEIHTALALLGEKDSVLHIVREFKRDEEDSKIKGIIESIDTEVLGEVFEELELYDDAENLYTKNGMLKQAAKMRRNKAAQGAAKIDQTVVHGDYVDDRDTIVKDSVINRSNIGSNSKAEDLREAKSLFEEGLIDQSEYKQMKKDILGK